MIDKNKLELIAQVIEAMNDLVRKIEIAYKRQDLEELNLIKKEMLNLQGKVAGLIK